jgi:hypothetical protein
VRLNWIRCSQFPHAVTRISANSPLLSANVLINYHTMVAGGNFDASVVLCVGIEIQLSVSLVSQCYGHFSIP